jgi:MFS family permease
VWSSWFVRAVTCVFLLTTSIDLIRPMVSYRALELGANTAQVGLIAASYAILSLMVAIPTGQLVDRIGETRFIIAGGTLMAAVAIWLATAASLLTLGIGQALLGAGQIFGLVALQTLVANCSPARQRDARFGIFAVMGSVGQVVGPTLGGAISSTIPDGPRAALLTSTLFLVGLILLAASLQRWPPPSNERAGEMRRQDAAFSAMIRVLKIRSMPQAMLASLTVLATIDILVAYVPVYGEANGIPVTTVGLLLSARAAAGALSRLAMVPMLKALGRRRLFILGLLLPAFALFSVPFTSSVTVLITALSLAGFGLGLGQPMSLAWVTRAAPPDSRGIAVGVRLTGNRAGQVGLPALVGAIGGATSVGAIFVALGAVLFASAAFILSADFGVTPD